MSKFVNCPLKKCITTWAKNMFEIIVFKPKIYKYFFCLSNTWIILFTIWPLLSLKFRKLRIDIRPLAHREKKTILYKLYSKHIKIHLIFDLVIIWTITGMRTEGVCLHIWNRYCYRGSQVGIIMYTNGSKVSNWYY